MAETKKKTTKKKKEETAMEVAEEKAMVQSSEFDYGEDMGFADDAQEDMIIPRLKVLQKMSPEPDEIEGAKPGMLFNTVTQELMDSVNVVVAKTEKVFFEWIPRDEGGGRAGVHDPKSDFVKQARAETPYGKIKLDNGNELIETVILYCAVLDENKEPTGQYLVADFTSTKIQVYKKWNTSVLTYLHPLESGKKVRVPMFAHAVRLGTTSQQNKHGTFYNYTMGPVDGTMKESVLPSNSDAVAAAKQLRQLVESGEAKAKVDQDGDDSGDSSSGEDAPF